MQKNIQQLPSNAFTQIEEIITQASSQESTKPANSVIAQKVPGQHRKMSQVYQNIQKLEQADSKTDSLINDLKKSLETIRER